MQKRKMYQSPITFILMIPLGVILIVFLANYGMNTYKENKFKDDSKNILISALERREITSLEEQKKYITKKYQELDYETEELILTKQDECLVMVNYSPYETLKSSIFKTGGGLASTSLIGCYNEFNEIIIEEYNEEN